MSFSHEQAVREIIAAGNRLDARGLAPATSGNYSARLADGRIAVTVSGRHKGRLNPEDIMVVDASGKPLENKKPSAETQLHILLYRLYPNVNAVLHAHSVPGVALTRLRPMEDNIVLEDYELLKAFPGVDTHDTRIEIPVFDNTQDIDVLAGEAQDRLLLVPETPAFLIKSHGLYAWGKDMAEAERVTEALEHLLLCEIETMKINGRKIA